MEIDLGAVIESIIIGVGQEGIGFMDVDFLSVT